MAHAGGAPSDYKVDFNEQARKLCLLGATDAELAGFFGVDERTINRWKIVHPEFCQAIKKGKEVADAEVADSLYQRAKGYSHPEDQIFQFQGEPVIVPTTKHYPPDTAAAFIWLKNRRGKDWREKVEAEVTFPDGLIVRNSEGKEISRVDIVPSKKKV
jgi:hypothetical protein